MSGQYTPQVYGWIGRLSGWMPFAAAAKIATALLGVEVSKSSAMRIAEKIGAAYVAQQTEEAARLERQAPPAPSGARQMVVSADGAMVPLVHGEWGEVRTLAVGTVVKRSPRHSKSRTRCKPAPEQPAEGAATTILAAGSGIASDALPGAAGCNQPVQGGKQKQQSALQTVNISYFSRFTSADTFTQLAVVETHQRGLENAGQVAAVMDGADWLQQFSDYHCPKAVRILDFAHAAQRIAEIAQALWGGGSEAAVAWTNTWTANLKEQGPQKLLDELLRLRTAYPDNEPLRINLAYLHKRQAQLAYPTFSQQGWPIGSGMVESANKLVVEARLKGAGMHWLRSHVDPMLALRNLLCNDRWESQWPLIKTRLITHVQYRRRPACQQRLQTLHDQERTAIAATQHAQYARYAALHPQPCPEPKPSSPQSPTPKSNKPAPNHPWRRFPISYAKSRQSQKI